MKRSWLKKVVNNKNYFTDFKHHHESWRNSKKLRSRHDRRELKKMLCDEHKRIDECEGLDELEVLDFIQPHKHIPVTLQVERKMGKWLRAGTHHGVQMYQCSECGEEEAVPEATNFQTGETEAVWEYCPYCGVNMRGK